MTKSELEQLYRQLIIPESKNPYHFEKKDGDFVHAYNPVCGDTFKIFTNHPIHFHGHGCALSKASGSLMMRLLENKTPPESKKLIDQFIRGVQFGNFDALSDQKLATMALLKKYDGREDCILLTWKAMLDRIDTLKSNTNA